MLLKLKAKIGSEIKTVLIERSSIAAVIPYGNYAHVYVKSLTTPIEAQISFDRIQAFLVSTFAEGVLAHERT